MPIKSGWGYFILIYFLLEKIVKKMLFKKFSLKFVTGKNFLLPLSNNSGYAPDMSNTPRLCSAWIEPLGKQKNANNDDTLR